MERPIILVIEEAKGAIQESVNNIREKTRLPASIMDGIICSVLADIRKESCQELSSAATMEKQQIAKAIQNSLKPKAPGADQEDTDGREKR